MCRKNKEVPLRFLFTYLQQTFSILRNILPWFSKELVHVLFCVFQTISNKAVSSFFTLPEMIRKMQMIVFYYYKTWLGQKTEKPKTNKGSSAFPPTNSKYD